MVAAVHPVALTAVAAARRAVPTAVAAVHLVALTVAVAAHRAVPQAAAIAAAAGARRAVVAMVARQAVAVVVDKTSFLSHTLLKVTFVKLNDQ